MARKHVVTFVFVIAEGVCGREREAGNLWVSEAGEDSRLGDDGDLEGEAEAVVEEDVRNLGLGDIGVDAGHGICEGRLLKDLFPEFGEGGACAERSPSATCPEHSMALCRIGPQGGQVNRPSCTAFSRSALIFPASLHTYPSFACSYLSARANRFTT